MRAGLTLALLATAAAITGVFLGNNILSATPVQQSNHALGKVPPAQDATAGLDRDYLSASESETALGAGLLPTGIKSLLKTDGPLRHGEYKWDEAGVAGGDILIWVDLRTQLISVFRGGHEIGTAVIVYGAETMQSPLGRFPILSKRRDYHSRSYDAPMPYSLFITNGGVALHGSPMSRRRATHGCIGLPVEFAKLLFGAAKTGDVVHIVRSKPVPAPVASLPSGS